MRLHHLRFLPRLNSKSISTYCKHNIYELLKLATVLQALEAIQKEFHEAGKTVSIADLIVLAAWTKVMNLDRFDLDRSKLA